MRCRPGRPGLLHGPTLLEIFRHLPQAKVRNLAAHRYIADALQSCRADAAAEWTRKHPIDFQRGFAMTGLDMTTPIATPTSVAGTNKET